MNEVWDLLIQSAHPHFSETRVRPGWCQCTCLPAVKPTSDGHQACKEETDQSCCGQDVKGNLPMGSSVLVAVGLGEAVQEVGCAGMLLAHRLLGTS